MLRRMVIYGIASVLVGPVQHEMSRHARWLPDRLRVASWPTCYATRVSCPIESGTAVSCLKLR
jgi:hypothetical protein